MKLLKIEIERFKRIKSAVISDIGGINVLVGENNAGKSSILQAIHFSVTAQVTRSRIGQETFSIDRTPYMPSSEFAKLKNGSPYGNAKSADNSSVLKIEYEMDQSKLLYEITIRRGRNDDNISCTTKGDARIGQLVSNQIKPFTVFVPGLAGIPTSEEYSSKAVVLRGLASGESNLYLRNVILRVQEIGKLSLLNDYIKDYFPGSSINVDFEVDKHETIRVYQNSNGHNLPIEIAGTGFIQVAQIYSYVILFEPSLLLLDEPDSHLHPDNQKKLCISLVRLSEDFGTIIFLSTHSKHMIEGLYGSANFIRMKDGEIKESGDHLSRLPMLVDIGALDKYDKLKSGNIEWIILTEDSNEKYLEYLLEKNGFPKETFIIVTYKSCSNISAAIVLIEFIKEVSANSKVIIHRDRDFMIDSEVEQVKNKIKINGGIDFITDYSDIESYFCHSSHVASVLQKSERDITDWVNELSIEKSVQIQHEFTRKRDELRSMYRDNPKNSPDTLELLGSTTPFPFEKIKGKLLLKIMNNGMKTKWGKTQSLMDYSPHIVIDRLQEIKKAT